MRQAGAIVAQTLASCVDAVAPGVTTGALDALAHRTFSSMGGEGLFRWYPTYVAGEGFPGHTCISVNEEIVHGIPGERELVEGDLITIDCGVRFEGWCADSAVTVGVGALAPDAQGLLDTTRASLELAIELVRPGRRWSEVARRMQRLAVDRGYGIVREFVGHGIGRQLHEPPRVPNYVDSDAMRDDFVMQPGMTFAIEPMLTLGSPATETLRDRWTVVTRDRKLAAHVEHTIAVTSAGAEVLTGGRH